MRNSFLKVRVRSCVDNRVLRHVTPKEARQMCGEDFEGNTLADVDAVAMRLTRKKETLKDIRLLHPERAHDTSPCSISARESTMNAFIESGLALRSTDSISEMDSISNKIKFWPAASENNRAVTIVPGGVIGLTVCSAS